MMMKTHVILSVMVAVLCCCVVEGKPWYCRSFDCPRFTTVSSTGDYDVRNYDETKWLATSITTSSPWPNKGDRRSMFMKMFPYFMMAQNAKTRFVKMAVPVLYKVEANPDGKFKVTMMLYVSASSPPAPNNPDVSIVTRPAMDVYVSGFTQIKWPENSVFDATREELQSSIADTATFDPNTYFRVSYNYPFDLRRKHHEVWVDKI